MLCVAFWLAGLVICCGAPLRLLGCWDCRLGCLALWGWLVVGFSFRVLRVFCVYAVVHFADRFCVGGRRIR